MQSANAFCLFATSLPAPNSHLRLSKHSREKSTLTTEFPEYEIRAYIQQHNNWTDHIFDSRKWTVYRAAISALTDNIRAFVIKLGHNWLPVGVRERRCGAATDTCPKCIQPETVPHLYLCHSRTTLRDQFITQLAMHLKDTSTAAASTAADLRCTIERGIQQWFLTDDTNATDEADTTIQLGCFQIIKGYLPQEWSITQALFFRAQGFDARYNTGERWTSQLITFFWTQSHNLWKDLCVSARAPAADTLDKSSARTRQIAQYRLKMTYAHNPLMLAIGRRIFDTPLEKCPQARSFDLFAWTTTISPVIHHSISQAGAQIRSGHHDIRTYFADTAEPESTTDAMSSVTTMLFRPTWHEMGNCIPILAIVNAYRIPQLGVFVGRPS
jgi:hypothetical protein